jgi:hypothetical protein
MTSKVARIYVLRQRFFAILTTFEIKSGHFLGLKVHKHEIIMNFFLALIKTLYALG